MSNLAENAKRLASGGALIALALVAGCGSSNDARAGNKVTGSTPVGAAAKVPEPPTGNAAVADFALPAADPAAFVDDTLCEAGETSFFSCEIGSKHVSVCGRGSRAIYRYGRRDRVELTSRDLTFARRGYSGGGELQLTAGNGAYTYTVFECTIRTAFGDGGNDPAFSSGLVIARGPRVISSSMCEGEASVHADAELALPAGRFVEH